MSYYGLTAENINSAIRQHMTTFFNADLNPITPIEGQWFCEFHIEVDHKGEQQVRDEAMVEYVGAGRVCPEGSDEDRYPQGKILIAQS